MAEQLAAEKRRLNVFFSDPPDPTCEPKAKVARSVSTEAPDEDAATLAASCFGESVAASACGDLEGERAASVPGDAAAVEQTQPEETSSASQRMIAAIDSVGPKLTADALKSLEI